VKKRKEFQSADLQRCPGRSVGVESIADHTAIELTGTDRPGLLSEVSAVLTQMQCNVNAAEVWTHNSRVACVVYVTDGQNGGPVKDKEKLGCIKELLSDVMGIDGERRGSKTDFAEGITHTERRLHQMMFADRDYEGGESSPRLSTLDDKSRPHISVQKTNDRGYVLVNVQCRDRPKLLFDTVCALTDMQFVVFHATIHCTGFDAVQEYYIRHVDGCPLDAEGERRIRKCLEAAIKRRSSEVELHLTFNRYDRDTS
jgi:UTP:GlnB (protein PII) uridylyltransferase